MTHLITYCDENMTQSAQKCINSSTWNNVHSAKIMGAYDIDAKFYKKNEKILSEKRGCGLWLWKPYIIDKELAKLAEGDHLIYSDAGIEFCGNVNYILDRMTSDIWLFGNMYEHKHWCKADIIKAIGGDPSGKQVQASVIVIRNSKASRAFVKEWLKWCQVPGLIDDIPSKEPNDKEFKENRHDQAILTQLAKRDGMALHWWPAKYNNGAFEYPKEGYEADNYPVLFHHHRKRNNEW